MNNDQPESSTLRHGSVTPSPDKGFAELAPGVILADRYAIEKELGRGGFSIVYLARDQKIHDRLVVIKLLLEGLGANENKVWFEKKFKEEIRALSRINHPGVVRALDIGELPSGRTYLVMQYVPGESLRSQMGPQGMELKRVAKLIRQIGHALTGAHEQGVLHRDIKPENIMLQSIAGEEYIKLIDFGIASVLDKAKPPEINTTSVAGTVGYMAPEQLMGKPSAASDIYALGVISYEMLTGRLPFNPISAYQLLELQRDGVRIKPRTLRADLPKAAQAVILKSLSFNPENRQSSAKAFGDALAESLETSAPLESPEDGLRFAHVLFINLPDHSSLPAEKQASAFKRLETIVETTNTFRHAGAGNRLFSMATGDGVAVVYLGSDPTVLVNCAIEASRASNSESRLRVRMCVHTGPVQLITDGAGDTCIVGEGFDVARLLANHPGGEHILVTGIVADALRQLNAAPGMLQAMGKREVLSGERIELFNLHAGDIGQPLPTRSIQAFRQFMRSRTRTGLAAIIITLGAAIIAVAVWQAMASRSQPVPAEQPVVERRLSYSLIARKDPKRFSQLAPFAASSETVFEAYDQVRVSVNSPQDGFLYIINERPVQTEGLPVFNLLFPSPSINAGSAEVWANQTIRIPDSGDDPEEGWFVFDDEEGTEKLWLIWSERSVDEIEAVKDLVNPIDHGEIKDPNHVLPIKEYLAAHSTTMPEIGEDQATKRIDLKGRGQSLVALLKLEHRSK